MPNLFANFVKKMQESMSKREIYEELLPEIKSVVEGESDAVANMANVASMLHEAFGFWWTGFYRVLQPLDAQEEILVLGPFQGPLACTRIKKGRGVCGTAWAEMRTVVVPNVHEFPGHIACSSLSNSEIVVPMIQDGRMVAELDIDSKEFGTFDEVDAAFLEEVCRYVTENSVW